MMNSEPRMDRTDMVRSDTWSAIIWRASKGFFILKRTESAGDGEGERREPGVLRTLPR